MMYLNTAIIPLLGPLLPLIFKSHDLAFLYLLVLIRNYLRPATAQAARKVLWSLTPAVGVSKYPCARSQTPTSPWGIVCVKVCVNAHRSWWAGSTLGGIICLQFMPMCCVWVGQHDKCWRELREEWCRSIYWTKASFSVFACKIAWFTFDYWHLTQCKCLHRNRK